MKKRVVISEDLPIEDIQTKLKNGETVIGELLPSGTAIDPRMGPQRFQFLEILKKEPFSARIIWLPPSRREPFDAKDIPNIKSQDTALLSTRQKDQISLVSEMFDFYDLYVIDPIDGKDSYDDEEGLMTRANMRRRRSLEERRDRELGTDEYTKYATELTPGQKYKKENKAYYKGLSKSTADKRKAAFKADAKKDDDKPSSYRDSYPGDARAKTRTSKHTKAYHKKFGESTLDEKNKALENKSKESGIAYGILKQVYNRGLAAWKSGHRPGANQQQWGYARVNSFITGGTTRRTADKDLWQKHKGKKESIEEKRYEVNEEFDSLPKVGNEVIVQSGSSTWYVGEVLRADPDKISINWKHYINKDRDGKKIYGPLQKSWKFLLGKVNPFSLWGINQTVLPSEWSVKRVANTLLFTNDSYVKLSINGDSKYKAPAALASLKEAKKIVENLPKFVVYKSIKTKKLRKEKPVSVKKKNGQLVYVMPSGTLVYHSDAEEIIENKAKTTKKTAKPDVQNESLDGIESDGEAEEMLDRIKQRAIIRKGSDDFERPTSKSKARFSTRNILQKRAVRLARALVFKRESGGKTKSELSFSQRLCIEKTVAKKKNIVLALAKKLYPIIDQKDQENKLSKK